MSEAVSIPSALPLCEPCQTRLWDWIQQQREECLLRRVAEHLLREMATAGATVVTGTPTTPPPPSTTILTYDVVVPSSEAPLSPVPFAHNFYFPDLETGDDAPTTTAPHQEEYLVPESRHHY